MKKKNKSRSLKDIRDDIVHLRYGRIYPPGITQDGINTAIAYAGLPISTNKYKLKQ